MEEGTTTTKLLTLLNVSAVRTGKRKRSEISGPAASRVKLNKKRANLITNEEGHDPNVPPVALPSTRDGVVADSSSEEVEILSNSQVDHITTHFGNSTTLVNPRAIAATSPTDTRSKPQWKIVAGIGKGATFTLVDKDGPVPGSGEPFIDSHWESEIHPKLLKTVKASPSGLNLGDAPLQFRGALLEMLVNYKDLFLTRMSTEQAAAHKTMRDSVTLHLVNHVMKIRRLVLRNNDRIAAAANSQPPGSVELPSPESIQDQGFTRPSTLILVPFRNSAIRWMDSYLAHFPAKSNQEMQVHNHARFLAEFSLPTGAVDKLAEGYEATRYPPDHVENFKGNIDDNFRLGVKITKKSIRLFEKFYGSDLIIASPLGLRLALEKERNADFLSSIEIVVMDQVDVMAMQNWEHVKFIFSKLNTQPVEAHDTDFGRVKSWYLDGHAAKLRQNILISAYETPQMRAFFTNDLRNIGGKNRVEKSWEAVKVPEGVKQEFIKFECSNSLSEPDKRFEHFTKELFPGILKSAVQSANTVIFVPSYFDFVRIKNWIRKEDELSVTWLSEDSTTKDISRAREAFFSGKKSFLVVTERFHFFRRYRIRGVLNVIFYGPPDHASFYSEFLSFPFIDEGVEPADVTCKLLYSKYDAMALERIVGTRAVGPLLKL